MSIKAFYIILILLSTSCQAQPMLEAKEIYDSRIDSYISRGKEIDSIFFNSSRFWLQYEHFSVLGNEQYGIEYIYDFESKNFMKINGRFERPRPIQLSYDYTGGIGHNFYFDDGLICWLTKSIDPNQLILRSVDIRKNENQEIVFEIPEQLIEMRPVIIDIRRLLYHNYLLKSDGDVDTLQFENNTTFPDYSDKIFMRKNAFVVDKYYDQESPNYSATETNPIEFNYITNDRLITQIITINDKDIGNYKIESNYQTIWLLSNKIYPHQFLLYEAETGNSYPFTLDKSIFRLENLSEIEPIISTETAPGQNVKFSYLTSMTENYIYVYLIKNGIKLYKISDYRKLIE